MTDLQPKEPLPQTPEAIAYVIGGDPAEIIDTIPLRVRDGFAMLSGKAVRACFAEIAPDADIYIPDRQPEAPQREETAGIYTFFDETVTVDTTELPPRIYLRGELVHLPPRARDLAAYLGRTPGIAQTHDKILQEVWWDDYPYIGKSAVTQNIHIIRDGLGHMAITTCYAVGYSAHK